MLDILTNLTKVTVGTVLETPAAIVADFATLGGALTDKEQPYTAEALSKVFDNISKITK